MSPNRVKLIIRPFRMADLDGVYDIERRSFPSPWPRLLFRRYHYKNPQGFLVAERDGEVIGCAIAEIVKRREPPEFGLKRRGHLLNLAVDPRFRRQGVGNVLMKFIIRYLQKEKAEDLWLEVPISNSGARKFYSKLGFEERGQRLLYYWNEDAVIMSLNIKER